MPASSPAQQDFIRRFNSEVLHSDIQLAQEGRALLTAHACLESGYGTAKAWKHGFNFGNITAGSTWHGLVFRDVGGDTAYDKDGKFLGKITQDWRVYPSVQAALADYWQLLGWRRYVRARLALALGDLAGFCHFLGPSAGKAVDPRTRQSYDLGGYYTLPEPEYARRLAGVLALVKSSLLPDPSVTPPMH